ncbi:MAG: MBL fold metallo-hydrolase [Ignavibacteriales bacterium]|nr:MBL fold metallo-hydrolase [Ignavibacteriales bacterium]
MKKKIFIGIGISVLVILIGAVIVLYPMIRFMTQKEIVQIDPTLTLVLGGGGNSGIIIGDSAVVVIDTKMMGNSEDLYKLAKERTGQKPIIVINTHYHKDHVSGNKFYKGSKIYIGSYGKEFLLKNIDAENQPTDFVKDSLVIDLGNEKVHLYNIGQGHTTNDLVVYLSNRHILFTGDLVFYRINPVLKKESGANVSRWICLLDTIVSRWGDSKIVPGHGQVGDKELVITLRQYFVDMTAAVTDPSKKDKYKDWLTMPGMASPEKTVEFIRNSGEKK